MDKLLLTPDEARQLIGVGRSKFYAMLADRTVPSIRVGNSLRVPVKALERWIDREVAGGTGGDEA